MLILSRNEEQMGTFTMLMAQFHQCWTGLYRSYWHIVPGTVRAPSHAQILVMVDMVITGLCWCRPHPYFPPPPPYCGYRSRTGHRRPGQLWRGWKRSQTWWVWRGEAATGGKRLMRRKVLKVMGEGGRNVLWGGTGEEGKYWVERQGEIWRRKEV